VYASLLVCRASLTLFTAGEKVSLALVAQVPVPPAAGVSAGGEGSLGWWSDTQADLFRKACDKSGKYCYTPLYTMKRRIGWVQRLFRQNETTPSGDDLCVTRALLFCQTDGQSGGTR
jgi:hypothetical protein